MTSLNLRRGARATVVLLAAGSLLSAGVPFSVASAAPRDAPRPTAVERTGEHDLRSPMAVRQDALRSRALQKVLAGEATPTGPDRVVRLAKGQHVSLARQRTDRVFVLLAEFGDARHPSAPDLVPDTRKAPAQRSDGPLHDEIPAPDRTVDTSTLWQPSYDRAHYERLYFDRLAAYYASQSSGRYSLEGAVTDWVRVPFNQARYGRNTCGDIVCPATRALVRDALAFWVDDQLRSGRTLQQVSDHLRTFDVQDRYDADGDGVFAEPDGFLDRFQVVHAGGDEASGDPVYGEDAIWSHRSYAFVQTGGPGGLPGVDVGSGGVDAGQTIPHHPTGVWVGDYTMQPENGGLGIVAHEYGHDLGLPDLYDTSGNTGGAENSTAFWSLMSSGSNLGDGSPDGVGDAPVDLGTWEKLQLGWLDYEVALAGQRSTHRLAPSTSQTRQAQAVITVLPDKLVPVELGAPCATCGSRYFTSGSGDDRTATMHRAVPRGSRSLTAQVRHDVEQDWDYAFLEASVDGTTWTPVTTTLSDGADDQSGLNASRTGLTGARRSWTALSATLPAGTTAIRFRSRTDGAHALAGFSVDSIAVDGRSLGTAETDEGWTLDGFATTSGSGSQAFAHYYVAENRQYVGYDASLRTAYNLGFGGAAGRPALVETHPYEDGLLVHYWDTSQTDNDVGEHPGSGLVLPVDAHPVLEHAADGHLLRPRILSYDSTFGLEPTTPITVHKEGRPTRIASKPAVPVFDDTRSWWTDAD